jgi:hypothetical protein
MRFDRKKANSQSIEFTVLIVVFLLCNAVLLHVYHVSQEIDPRHYGLTDKQTHRETEG